MATTMTAAVLHGREDIRIERVPILKPVRANDRPRGRGADLWNRSEGLRRVIMRADRASSALRHEQAGTVVEAAG